MNLARNSIRHLVKAELAARIRARLGNVIVGVGWPGEDLADDSVWVADVEGDINTALYLHGNGRSARDDSFIVRLVVQTYRPDGDREAAESAAAVLMAAIEDVLAEDPQLGGMDGLICLGGTDDGEPTCRAIGPNAHELAGGGVMADAAIAIPGLSRHN